MTFKDFILDYRTVNVWHFDSVNLRTFIGNEVKLLRELCLSHKTQLLNLLSVTELHRVVSPVVTHKDVSYISRMWPLQSPKYVSVAFLNVDDNTISERASSTEIKRTLC